MQTNRYVRLSKEELLTLEEAITNHAKAHFRIRCASLVLSSRGYQVAELAKLYQVRTHTVRAWMDSWEQKGIAGLQIAVGRGRKAAIQPSNTELVAQIKQELSVNPQRLEQVGAQINQKTGLSLSKDQLKRFIKKS